MSSLATRIQIKLFLQLNKFVKDWERERERERKKLSKCRSRWYDWFFYIFSLSSFQTCVILLFKLKQESKLWFIRWSVPLKHAWCTATQIFNLFLIIFPLLWTQIVLDLDAKVWLIVPSKRGNKPVVNLTNTMLSSILMHSRHFTSQCEDSICEIDLYSNRNLQLAMMRLLSKIVYSTA